MNADYVSASRIKAEKNAKEYMKAHPRGEQNV
jgi:hypothetical protein